jgi:anti-sigma factor RsiW
MIPLRAEDKSMKCSDYIEWITRKVDGTLAYEDLKRLDAHLKDCETCRLELALQTEIHRSLKSERHSGLSADFTRRVSREALALAGKEKRRWRLADLIPVFSVAAAGVLLAIFRSEVVQFLSPAAEMLGSALASGGSAIEASASDALAEAPGMPEGASAYLKNLFTPTVITMTAGAFAIGTVFWSLTRVRAYLRD